MNIIQIGKKRVFTLESANQILKTIQIVTEKARIAVGLKLRELEEWEQNSPQSRACEEKINVLTSEWQAKITKLGAEPKGLWLVDFDSGDGYFCWKYPELSVDHFHSYTEGVQSRRKVD